VEKPVQVQVQKDYSEGLAAIVKHFFNQWKYPVCVIYGNPDTGKTDTSLLIDEIGLNEGALDYFGSNIQTFGKGQRITSLEEVTYWFAHQPGKKCYTLDEAGIHDDTRSPLCKMNVEIRHKVFTIRKFRGHIIFVLQEIEDLDKWKHSELTGMIVKKLTYGNEFLAKIKAKWYQDLITIRDMPQTTLPYDTLDIAPFTLERQITDVEVELKGLHAKAAYLYAKGGNFSVICKQLKEETGKDWKPMQVKRLIQQYLREQLRMDATKKADVI
jgi:hypothetical protein